MIDYNKKILELLKKEEVVTISEVARFLNISWNTAEKYLLELTIEGKVKRKRKEAGTLWLKA